MEKKWIDVSWVDAQGRKKEGKKEKKDTAWRKRSPIRLTTFSFLLSSNPFRSF